jgi:hypothetical protein
LVQRITISAAEARSFKRATIVMWDVGDSGVAAKTIERVVRDVDGELAERRDAAPVPTMPWPGGRSSRRSWPSSSTMGADPHP